MVQSRQHRYILGGICISQIFQLVIQNCEVCLKINQAKLRYVNFSELEIASLLERKLTISDQQHIVNIQSLH